MDIILFIRWKLQLLHCNAIFVIYLYKKLKICKNKKQIPTYKQDIPTIGTLPFHFKLLIQANYGLCINK